jgi:uncharacterized RDD family membrane protein YckC
MNLDIPNGTPNPSADLTSGPEYSFPPLADFWRRLLAFIIDVVLVAAVGQIIGWSLSSFWYQVGPNARIVGFLIIFLYFGLTYSKIFNGQTLGKRILKLAVRGKDNRPSAWAAFCALQFLRCLYTGVWQLTLPDVPGIGELISVIVFGVGITVVYTMIFNRSGRQGIHDLICRTYVIRLKGEPIESFPESTRRHWVISGVLTVIAVIIVVALSAAYNGVLAPIMGIDQLEKAQKTLQTDDRFFLPLY